MTPVGLSAFILATTTSVVFAALYEDDPRYLEHQKAADFLSVQELLLVQKQSMNPLLYPATICQAMKKVPHMRRTVYKYAMYYISPRTQLRVTYFVTILVASTTAPHLAYNQMSYQTVIDGARFTFKLMFADKDNGCFILVINYGTFGRGCRLLRTASTVTGPAVDDCERVYAENCPRRSLQIYQPECRRRIHHNAW